MVSIVGEGISSALESKVIFLDKIGKVSFFLQGVLDLGNVLCDVCDCIYVRGMQLTLRFSPILLPRLLSA